MTVHQLISFLSVTLLFGCGRQSSDTTDINQASVSVDTPGSFVKNYGVNESNHLFAFVGEKISVEPLPHKQSSMDYGFKAKYRILEKAYGNFPEDTIEFVAYDHYGIPSFSTFKNVLLYVSANGGTYYHQKYLYNDVYKTNEGRWAGTYPEDDYNHPYNKHTKIKPVKIRFAGNVSFPTKMVDSAGQQLKRSYPKPYFKTVGDRATAIYGNYIEDLVTLKKTGVLTARGLFDASAAQEEDMVEASQPEQSKRPPGADDLKFLSFWKVFVASLKEPGLKNFRKIALDTLYMCDQLLPADRFITNVLTR
jgi:hypothetical protein